MQVHTLGYYALRPMGGFRWIYRESPTRWRFADPPTDWAEGDYFEAQARYAARSEEEVKALVERMDRGEVFPNDLSEKFYLAAAYDDMYYGVTGSATGRGDLLYEPDLYLRFASQTPTPSAIQQFANEFGLLRNGDASREISKKAGKELLPDFASELLKDARGKPVFYAEKAADWIFAVERVRFNLRIWDLLRRRNNYEAMASHLRMASDFTLQSNLTLRFDMDSVTGEVSSEAVAATLDDLIDIQWATSIGSNVVHRQCTQCQAWFAVHPGLGRPEKLFCSDACRMRSYRARKARYKAKTKKTR